MTEQSVTTNRSGARRWRFKVPQLTPEQAFAIASDVERYPEFVPGCIATRVIHRHGNQLLVDNIYGFGMARHRFTTQAYLILPHGLSIVADPDPWIDFAMYWTFAPLNDGVDVQVTMKLQLHGRLLKLLPNALFSRLQGSVIDAFEKRARAASH